MTFGKQEKPYAGPQPHMLSDRRGSLHPGRWRNSRSGAAKAAGDALRNQLANKECVRGHFRDYHLQGRGGDPPADYAGRVFKLSQDYPTNLPPMEDYPWLKIAFKDGGPVDPRAYLQALLDYGLAGNVDVDFYVEDNRLRKWYGMPWMDWNTEVASDWPGTDGREFVHGLTHEFDLSGKTLSTLQNDFVDTWSGAYLNDRAAFGVGQVYCDSDNPKPGALESRPQRAQQLPQRVVHHQAALLDGDRRATADREKCAGVESGCLRQRRSELAQQGADIAVRTRHRRRCASFRSTFPCATSAARQDGSWEPSDMTATPRATTPWERMTPLGIQWGNSPKVAFAETCAGPGGPCSRRS